MEINMKEEILEILEEILPAIDFTASDTMMDDKTLDSVTIVQIISELSVEYDVDFSFEDLTPENFNSIDAIVALVESKLN